MGRLASGTRAELIAAEVRKRMSALNVVDLGSTLNLSPREVLDSVHEGLPDDIEAVEYDGATLLVRREIAHQWSERAVKAVAAHHRRNPLEKRGMRVRELAGPAGAPVEAASESTLAFLLKRLCTDGILKQVDDTFALREHDVVITPQLEARIAFVEKWLAEHGTKAPLFAELKSASAVKSIDDKELNRILRYLGAARRVYHVEDTYLHATVVNQSRAQLIAHLRANPTGVTVADFRDLIDGNRKICLLLLALFDSEGVTMRSGDLRVLGEAGTAGA